MLPARSAAAQETASPPVLVEAESGALGDAFETVTEGDVTCITITTDYNETTGTAGYPGAGRTATFEVAFSEAGRYVLYARLYVGPETWNDDSFFVGIGFGARNAAASADWAVVNGLAGGHTVTLDAGGFPSSSG